MICYNAPVLRLIETEIFNTFNSTGVDYPNYSNLLEIRKTLLNDLALVQQEKLLPDIITFNDALHSALRKMYDRAHSLFAQISAIQPDIELTAKCYFSRKYPPLHPYQNPGRQDLWDALCDSGWNSLYVDGVSHELVLSRDMNESFDTFIGMDCPPPNWNEGLDPELTKDLHLIQQFHHLFDHTNFALTDFIFVRDFNIEININFEENLKL